MSLKGCDDLDNSLEQINIFYKQLCESELIEGKANKRFWQPDSIEAGRRLLDQMEKLNKLKMEIIGSWLNS